MNHDRTITGIKIRFFPYTSYRFCAENILPGCCIIRSNIRYSILEVLFVLRLHIFHCTLCECVYFQFPDIHLHFPVLCHFCLCKHYICAKVLSLFPEALHTKMVWKIIIPTSHKPDQFILIPVPWQSGTIPVHLIPFVFLHRSEVPTFPAS